jgi:hypothetical protein
MLMPKFIKTRRDPFTSFADVM